MPAYRSWLVVDQPPETDEARSREPLLQLLDSFGFQRFVAGPTRPRVGLRIENDVATLVAKTPKDLTDFLNLVRTKTGVVAVALHPAAFLRKFHQAVFRTAGAAFELRVAQPMDDPRGNPYFRRMIRFQLVAVTSLQPTASGCGALVGPFEEHERLLLQPRLLDFDEQNAQELCAMLAQGLLATATCAVLPPVVNPDSLDPRSYFHESWRALRAAFATAMGITQAQAGEPLVTRLWRLQHDELMRDLLREGASLTVTVRAGSPARAVCNFPKPDALNPIASWRRMQLLEPDRTLGPSWARRLAAAIASDMEDAAVGAGDADLALSLVGLEQGAIPEQIEPLPPFEPSDVAREGVWQLLEACRNRLPEGDATRIAFDQAVLWPSNNDRRSAPDQRLALKAFMAYVWRCPWPEALASTDPWKEATTELVGGAFKESLSAAEVAQRTSGWPRVTRQGNALVLTLLPTLMNRSLPWALQLPVGSIVNDGGPFVLDDPEVTLDDAFVLA